MNYKKLAQLAHVSESTVSTALSGSRDISTALSGILSLIIIKAL